MTTTDPTAGPQIVSGDYDEAAAHHDAMLREIESLRSQLAEAREALVRVAKTLGWDAPPEQVPSGVPDLAIAVQQLRHERDQARGVLAEARQQRDQATEALVRAETERDEARAEIAKIAEALGFPGDLREAIRALRRERDDALQEAESVGRQLHGSTREVDRLIAQLATVTQERDRWQQLAEERAQNLHATLRRAFAAEDVALAARQEAEALKTERDEARAEIARLERAAHEQGADLWIAEDRLEWLRERARLAMDLLCSPTVPHEPGPDVPGAYGILSHALAVTAPQTDEQAQVRGESHTKPQTGSQGPLDLDAIRATWLRACGSCDAGYPTDCTCPPGDPRTVIAALVAEIDRLRTEVKQLSARVREWEAVHADLAARCDSGDIPIRLGERYSQAVLWEIDRLRTERDRLMDELPEDNTIVAAIRRLRTALNTQGGSR